MTAARSTPDSAAAGVSAPLLETVDVHQRFGGLQVLQGIDFSVRRGERRALIGPNGAGKSTFLNVLSGLRPPTSGRVRYRGRDITGASSFARARMGIGRTFQVPSLFDDGTVEENLVLALLASSGSTLRLWRPLRRHHEVMAQLDAAIEAWDLGPQRLVAVKELSYGDRRRLEIILSVLGQPQLLLLDEPGAGLSARETAQIIETVSALDPDLALVMVEHDMNLVFSVCDRVTVLAEGSILAEGTPEEVSNDPEVLEAYLGMPL